MNNFIHQNREEAQIARILLETSQRLGFELHVQHVSQIEDHYAVVSFLGDGRYGEVYQV